MELYSVARLGWKPAGYAGRVIEFMFSSKQANTPRLPDDHTHDPTTLGMPTGSSLSVGLSIQPSMIGVTKPRVPTPETGVSDKVLVPVEQSLTTSPADGDAVNSTHAARPPWVA